MNSSLSNVIPKFEDVARAVRELEKRGFVKTEERLRGSMRAASGVKDVLVVLEQVENVVDIVSHDPKLLEYMRMRERFFNTYKRG